MVQLKSRHEKVYLMILDLIQAGILVVAGIQEAVGGLILIGGLVQVMMVNSALVNLELNGVEFKVT